MSKHSKQLGKTDESAKLLLSEIFDNSVVKMTDIDSYYLINNQYRFVEFVKVDENDLTEYFKKLNILDYLKSISTITKFVEKAEGMLYVVFFNEIKTNFIVLRISDFSKLDFITKNFTFDEFKEWFQSLSKNALK